MAAPRTTHFGRLVVIEVDDASPETFEVFVSELVRAHDREKQSLAVVIAFKSLLKGLSPQLRDVVKDASATLAKMDLHTHIVLSGGGLLARIQRPILEGLVGLIVPAADAKRGVSFHSSLKEGVTAACRDVGAPFPDGLSSAA
jgi:hypothetical protein